jgi:hypothetical protein
VLPSHWPILGVPSSASVAVCVRCMTDITIPCVLLQGEPWQEAASPDHSLTWGSAAGTTAFGTPFFTPAPGSAQRLSPQQVG